MDRYPPAMIVTTGASGAVGGMVAAELSRLGVEQRLITRDPSRAPRLPGAEVVAAEYGDRESLRRALRPGDSVFMVSLHHGPAVRVPLHGAFIAAAAESRVAQIVYLSFVGAGRDAVFLHARSHGATEAMLGDSGVPYATIRNSMYADEIPGWFDAQGVDRSPCGDGRMSFSDRSDLARAIAVALTEPQHSGERYTITTPESVTQSELAEIASRVTGRPFTYEPADAPGGSSGGGHAARRSGRSRQD